MIEFLLRLQNIPHKMTIVNSFTWLKRNAFAMPQAIKFRDRRRIVQRVLTSIFPIEIKRSRGIRYLVASTTWLYDLSSRIVSVYCPGFEVSCCITSDCRVGRSLCKFCLVQNCVRNAYTNFRWRNRKNTLPFSGCLQGT